LPGAVEICERHYRHPPQIQGAWEGACVGKGCNYFLPSAVESCERSLRHPPCALRKAHKTPLSLHIHMRTSASANARTHTDAGAQMCAPAAWRLHWTPPPAAAPQGPCHAAALRTRASSPQTCPALEAGVGVVRVGAR